MNETFETVIACHARTRPTVAALHAHGQPSLTYAGLHAILVHVRTHLNSHSVGRCDRVGLFMPSRPASLTAYLSVASAATAVPLNPDLTVFELDLLLPALGLKAVIIDTARPDLAAVAERHAIPVILATPDLGGPAGSFQLSGGIAGPAKLPGPAIPDDFACVLSSSGTTGRPKAGRFLHRTLLFRARAESHTHALTPDDVTINFRPTYLSGALNIGLLATIWSGGAIVVPPGFDPGEFLHDLIHYGVTWYTGGPAHHRAILDQLSQTGARLPNSRLRFVRSAGYALPQAMQESIEALLGVPCIQKYGSSEAGPVSCNPMPPGVRKPGTTGLVQDCEVQLLDDDGNPTSEGEIHVRGEGVFSGYDDEALNREAFRGEWFRTGDLGHFDDDGYLVISGRMKEIINKGGQKISPQEVEAAFLAHPGVLDVLCFPVPHRTLGQTVGIAVVAIAPPGPGPADLRAFAASRLADYKIPAVIIQTDHIPEAASGKRSRVKAAEHFNVAEFPHDEGLSAGTGHPPHGRAEEIWSDVLKLERVDDAQNFTLMGGDSISAIRLVLAIEQAFGVLLDASVVYGEAATLGALKSLIASQPAKPASAIRRLALSPRADVTGDLPLTSSQWRLWSICKLAPHVPLYNTGFGIRFHGPLDTGSIAKAVDYVIALHDSLRATFVERNGVPRQVFLPPQPMSVGEVDLRSYPAHERQAAALSAARQLAARPYDLEHGPLVRADILILHDTEALLVLQTHHLVTDGRSAAILAEQLVNAKTDFAAGKDPSLSRPRFQFSDYVAWRLENIDEEESGRLIAFWLDEIANASGDLGALSERPRRQMPTYHGERIRLRISRNVCDGLRAVAANAGVSLFVVALAAFEVLLYRLTGQGNFVISTVIDNRPDQLRDEMVGFLLNTIPIRARLDADTEFRDYLRFAGRRMTRVLEHSEVPFDKLVQRAAHRRDGLESLKQVMFGFMPKESRGREWAAAAYEPFNFDHSRAHFDLSLVLAEAGGEIEGHAEFSTDMFDRPAVERIISRFETLLADIASDPARSVEAFRIIPDHEYALVRRYSTGLTTDYPRNSSLPDVFRTVAGQYPDSVAIACGDLQLRYRELDTWSDGLASMLQDTGVEAGHVVAISAERTPSLIAALLAILKLGATYLAIEPGLPDKRRQHILHASGAVLFLVQDMGHGGDQAVRMLPVPDRHDPRIPPGEGPRPAVSPEAIGYICYTSGTSGLPKGALISHRAILRLVKGADYAELGPGQRILQLSSVAFDASTFEIWGALLNGGTLVQPQPKQPTISEIADAIEESRITTLWMTAGLFHSFVDLRIDCFRNVRQLLAGGDVLSADHVRRFLEAHPQCRFVNGYGPTENTTFSTCCDVHLADLDAGTVPIGRPIANSTAYVLDVNKRLLPLGVEGDLYVGGDGVALGYLNMPDETRNAFQPDPFSGVAGARMYRTGDRARFLSNGKLVFLGRQDTQIKIRGFRVEVQEIEAALRRDPAVQDAVVVPQREGGAAVRSLIAFVVATAGAASLDPVALRRLASRELPDYMVPGQIVQVAALPLTANGKVDRKALLQSSMAGPQKPAFEPPRTPVEALLAEIWAHLLDIEKVSIDDDFFELGGHSLLVLQLGMRLEEEIALSIAYADFFRFPTIRALAAEITERLVLSDGGPESDRFGVESPDA